MTAPIVFAWTGSAMEPLPRFAKVCDVEFVVGERYQMVVQEERSMNSHRHYFAAIKEGWDSLPDDMAERWPTPEHLRRFALIKTGYSQSQQFVAGSKAEALRLAAFIRPIDEYSIVGVDECVVSRYTAQSQSLKAMGKHRFQESKNKVLDFIADLIGTTPAELNRARSA